MSENTAKELKKKLFSSKKNGYEAFDGERTERAYGFCEGYKDFLNAAKTERECAALAREMLEQAGFEEFDEFRGEPYPAGAKVYKIQRNKAVLAAVIGKKPAAQGVRIAAAHIDSPRLDLKPNPLYEDGEMGYFKTHYYGGIKKYQWPTVPLALHGVVCKADLTEFSVNIGEDESDPQFVITDILPHLDREQMSRKTADIIKGEELNVLVGSVPFNSEEESQQVKLGILNILFEKYGMTEDDFLSAELTLVPAAPSRDIGFDRSLIGGYGHDDRVCAYPALRAVIEANEPENTVLTVLADKEEIGSEGNTGMQSSFLKDFIADLARLEGVQARDVLRKSSCLSADVNAAFDPSFPQPFEKNNTAYINHGVCVTKYTGARGKSSTNDASAEYMGKIRCILDKNDVLWQAGEMGAVDAGGGGTVAMYIANLDVDTVDVGVPVLSMHSPFEVVSKLDVFSAYEAFSAFFAD